MAYIYWNVSPDIVRIGGFTLRWYGVLFALLFALGYLMGKWIMRVEHKDVQTLDTLLVYLILGTIIGARLGHCFFYEPGYYLRHPIEILEVWKGGLASHGGAIGVLVALYLYSRHHPDQSLLWLLDRVVVPTALGGVLIRVGNLFNSEILGNPTHVPWGLVFLRVDSVPRHPAQLYEAMAYLIIFCGLFFLYRRLQARTPPGLLVGIFFASVFSARFLIEFVKERQATYEQHLPLSVGQLLSIPFVLVGLFLIWRALNHVKRTHSLNRGGQGNEALI
jgi:phosphatidylglycerol---prolipoprotein diacylglyceryl transferase